MKYTLLFALLALACAGLFAQIGLYNLAYNMPLLEADSLLVRQGFLPERPEDPTMVHYYPRQNTKVESITLVVIPDTYRLAGWMIKYNPNNTEEEDNRVFNTLIATHRDWFKNYPETGQIVWLLDEGRTVHLVYLDSGQLSVLYYNAEYDNLFHSEIPAQPAQPGESPDTEAPEQAPTAP